MATARLVRRAAASTVLLVVALATLVACGSSGSEADRPGVTASVPRSSVPGTVTLPERGSSTVPESMQTRPTGTLPAFRAP